MEFLDWLLHILYYHHQNGHISYGKDFEFDVLFLKSSTI
jgi:hypothetical protein